MYVFKALHGLGPAYISELFSLFSPQRSRRSFAQFLLIVPKSRLKTKGDRAFSVYAPKHWNTLPLEIRTSSTLSVFKNLLKPTSSLWPIEIFSFFLVLIDYTDFQNAFLFFYFIVAHIVLSLYLFIIVAMFVRHFGQHSCCFKVLYKKVDLDLSVHTVIFNIKPKGTRKY